MMVTNARRSAILAITLAFIAGLVIWLVWEPLFGTSEPWDGSAALLFPVILAAAGVAIGFVVPRRPFLAFAGAFAGQLAGLFLTTRSGPLVVLSPAFLLFFSIPLSLGALVGGWLRERPTNTAATSRRDAP